MRMMDRHSSESRTTTPEKMINEKVPASAMKRADVGRGYTAMKSLTPGEIQEIRKTEKAYEN
jgi:hypothetical protein